MLSKSGYILKFLLILSFTLTAGGYCKSSDPLEKQPGKKVALFCNESGPVRAHYEPEEGFVTKAGPVSLPDGVSCKDAEDQPESRIADFPEQGIWKVYYNKSNNLWQEGPFENGERSGTWKFYSIKGFLTKTNEFRNNKLHGPEIRYFENGDWRSKGQYANGKKTGRWEERPSLTSTCVEAGSYGNDNKEGQWKECALDKQTRDYYFSFEGAYRKGLRDGPAKLYYPNGSVFGEGNYRADIPCLLNPPKNNEGRPDPAQCQKRTGDWIIYFDNGNKRATGSYDPATGKRSGNWTEFYMSGEKMAEGQMNANIRYGMWTFFNKSGDIVGQYGFKGNSFMPKQAIFWENGNKTGEGPLAVGMVRYSDENDELIIKGMKRNGKWTHYYPSGRKKSAGTYQMDRMQGEWTFYDESGRMTAEGKFNLGRKDGVWKELENGRMVTKKYRFGKEL